MKLLNDCRIVLIADPVQDHFECDNSSLDLECPSMEYFNSVKTALGRIAEDVIWYKGPRDFMQNLEKHENDIVLSIWSGQNSMYRKAFIPTICEAYKIKYFGPDPYVQFLCQDKHLTKLYCKEFGIEGAKEVRIRSARDYDSIHNLTFPVIIKPNSEGGSNGISQESVVYEHDSAVKLCSRLLPVFGNDLLAEEYIQGTEVTVVISGNDAENLIIEQNEIVLENGIQNEIWGLESKKRESIDVPIRATNIIDKKTIKKFVELYLSFKKVELLRVDGRVYQDKFYLLELTPDVSLETVSSSACAFLQAGITYDKMFKVLLGNTMEYYLKS